MANCLAIQQKIDQTIPLTNQLLEEANREMAQLYLSHATQLLGEMVERGNTKMKLRFSLTD